MCVWGGGSDLVRQSLRGGVTDTTAVCHAHQLGAQLQYVGQWKVPNIGVLLPSRTENTRGMVSMGVQTEWGCGGSSKGQTLGISWRENAGGKSGRNVLLRL